MERLPALINAGNDSGFTSGLFPRTKTRKQSKQFIKETPFSKKNSISDIQKISENIASDIIEKISGDKLNESSIKAAVEDISKKNLGKYL